MSINRRVLHEGLVAMEGAAAFGVMAWLLHGLIEHWIQWLAVFMLARWMMNGDRWLHLRKLKSGEMP